MPRFRSLVTTVAFASGLLGGALQPEDAFAGSRPRTLVVQVADARLTPLSGTAQDADASSRTVGPFFVVKGRIVSVDGEPASGAYVAHGVFFTDENTGPGPGLAQVTVSFEIDGRGVLFAAGIEPRATPPSGAVTGGTGDFARACGVYATVGAPVDMGGDGSLTVTLKVHREMGGHDSMGGSGHHGMSGRSGHHDASKEPGLRP